MQIVSLQALVLTYNARATLPSAEAVAAMAALEEEFDFVPHMTSEGYAFGRSDVDSIIVLRPLPKSTLPMHILGAAALRQTDE